MRVNIKRSSRRNTKNLPPLSWSVTLGADENMPREKKKKKKPCGDGIARAHGSVMAPNLPTGEDIHPGIQRLPLALETHIKTSVKKFVQGSNKNGVL